MPCVPAAAAVRGGEDVVDRKLTSRRRGSPAGQTPPASSSSAPSSAPCITPSPPQQSPPTGSSPSDDLRTTNRASDTCPGRQETTEPASAPPLTTPWHALHLSLLLLTCTHRQLGPSRMSGGRTSLCGSGKLGQTFTISVQTLRILSGFCLPCLGSTTAFLLPRAHVLDRVVPRRSSPCKNFPTMGLQPTSLQVKLSPPSSNHPTGGAPS
eukprot:751524-Hanusia_phi.AAC.3